MRFVDNGNNNNPYQNLALEEYVFRQRMGDDDLPPVLRERRRPSSSAATRTRSRRFDPDVVDERGIHVVRRISGGGAVYHDLGNLNFSFMTPTCADASTATTDFNGPVIDVLRELGVPAELGGRNDILADGRKISGNAQFATPTRMFSHGTLLLDSNLDDVTAALRPQGRQGRVEGGEVDPQPRGEHQRVCECRIAVDDAARAILERIFGTDLRAEIPTLSLTAADWHGVRELQAQKYESWDWNYGQNPTSNVQRAERFAGGEIDVRYDIQEGRIAGVRIFGDFLGQHEVATRSAAAWTPV